MSAMTLQDIRDYVREHIDIEEDELTNAVLDIFVREGSDRIIHSERRWSFYQIAFTLPTVAAQPSYDLATITSDPISEIYDIRNEQWSLVPVDHSQARARFSDNTASSSRPTLYSVWADQLWLWPIPADVYQLGITGYRFPRDWIADGAGGIPDLPDEFHVPLSNWALSKAYAKEDDPEMAAFYREYFADQMNVFRRKYTGGLDAQPLVLGGSYKALSHSPSLGPLIYPWE